MGKTNSKKSIWRGSKFNLFCLGDLKNVVDVEGAVAVGGSLDATKGFSCALPEGIGSPAGGNTVPKFDIGLIVQGTVSGGNVVNNNGTVVLGETGDISSVDNGNERLVTTSSSLGIYFEDAKTDLLEMNQWMFEKAPTGDVGYNDVEVLLTGENTDINIFKVDMNQANGKTWRISVPDDAFIVINVVGEGKIDFDVNILDDQASDKNKHVRNTLINFDPRIETIALSTYYNHLYSAFFAPGADLRVVAGGSGINGNVVVNSLIDEGSTGFECHYYVFNIKEPDVPLPGDDDDDDGDDEETVIPDEPTPAGPTTPTDDSLNIVDGPTPAGPIEDTATVLEIPDEIIPAGPIEESVPQTGTMPNTFLGMAATLLGGLGLKKKKK